MLSFDAISTTQIQQIYDLIAGRQARKHACVHTKVHKHNSGGSLASSTSGFIHLLFFFFFLNQKLLYVCIFRQKITDKKM